MGRARPAVRFLSRGPVRLSPTVFTRHAWRPGFVPSITPHRQWGFWNKHSPTTAGTWKVEEERKLPIGSNVQIHLKGGRDGAVCKSNHCFCGGSGFDSQNPYQVSLQLFNSRSRESNVSGLLGFNTDTHKLKYMTL